MKRFLSLALLTCGAAAAGEPVSVYPPVAPIPAVPVPGGSLSQSLPSVIHSTLPTATAVAPPVMTGQSNWATPQPLIRTNWNPLITRSPVPCGTAAGYGSRGSLLERLGTWLCGGSGPAVHPALVPTPYQAPLRDYFPNTIVAIGGEGHWPSKCDARGGCAPAAVGPRPLLMPDYAPRPGLLRRLVDFFTPGCLGRARCQPTASVYGVPVPAATYSSGAVAPGHHFAGQQPAAQPVAYEQPAANKPFTVQR